MPHIKTELQPQHHLMQIDPSFGYSIDQFDPCYGNIGDPQQHQQEQQQLIVISSDQMMDNEMMDPTNQPSTSKLSSSSSSTSSKKRGCFPKSATNKLKHWLFQNLAVIFFNTERITAQAPNFFCLCLIFYLLAVTLL
jgi:hypothetical protein